MAIVRGYEGRDPDWETWQSDGDLGSQFWVRKLFSSCGGVPGFPWVAGAIGTYFERGAVI